MNTFNDVYTSWHNRKKVNWTTQSAYVSHSLMSNHVLKAIISNCIYHLPFH